MTHFREAPQYAHPPAVAQAFPMVAILFCQSGRVMGVRLKRSISSSKATMVESGSMRGQLGTRLLFEELVIGDGCRSA
jgi:hypothetical protein